MLLESIDNQQITSNEGQSLAFYRLPAMIRRLVKHDQKLQEGIALHLYWTSICCRNCSFYISNNSNNNKSNGFIVK